jgi:hypothetical protein
MFAFAFCGVLFSRDLRFRDFDTVRGDFFDRRRVRPADFAVLFCFARGLMAFLLTQAP